MSHSSVVLSISLLVSGKKDMEKSLKSLHFFKESFPCEIILVDTGCNAEQRALVDMYGDKIIDFAWCNDFAAARNAGLQEAKGEWFLYLDDDEWFDNPKEIIAFFQSGEYKKYNSAAYVVRNYTNAQGTFYEDACLSRMVKLEPGTRFIGKIHERLDPIKLPRKIFGDFVHHYGYVFENEEARQSHARRNIVPLLEMRKQYPGDPRWFGQLAQEYFAIGEYDKVLETCKEGLAEWNALEDKGDCAPVFVGATYGYILITLDSQNKYEEEKQWLEKAFADPICRYGFMEPTVAFYCMAGARLYSQLGDDENCRSYFQRYVAYAERLKDEKELLEVGTASVVEGVFQEQLLYGTTLMCLGPAIRLRDTGLVRRAFYLLDWNDSRLLRQDRWELDMLEAVCSVPYEPVWGEIFQTLVSRKGGMQEMYVVFLKKEIDYQAAGQTEELARLHRLAAGLDYEHYYLLCARILWNEENPELSGEEAVRRGEGLYRELFEKYPEKLLETRKEIWEAAKRLKLSLEEPLLQVDFLTWKRELQQWLAETSRVGLDSWEARIESWQSRQDIRYDYFYAKCAEGYLRYYEESGIAENRAEAMGQLEQLLWKYSERILNYYRWLYQNFVFEEKPQVLPEEAQLAVKLKRLRRDKEAGKDLEALRQLRGCLGSCPGVEKAIEAYARWYSEALKEQEKERRAEQDEFASLLAGLKQAARLQLEQGNRDAAGQLLRQLAQYAPEDEEIQDMLGKARK